MRSLRIGSPLGIPVQLHATLLVVVPLFAYLIGSRIGVTAELFNAIGGTDLAVASLTTGLVPWVLGSVAAVGLFACVLAHEFGHSLVARRYDHPIESITLWIFGGVARLTRLPEDWREELAIALAGPLVSVGLGVACYAAFRLSAGGPDAVRYLLVYLAVLNVALAAFNLLPAFPMDGGRVLRALLGRTRSFARATQLAVAVGKALSVVLGLVGLARLDPILVGIALFVFVAASGEARRVADRAALEGVAVGDVMTPSERLDVVGPATDVQALLDRMFRERHAGYPVVRDGRPLGVVTLDDARAVPDDRRPATPVAAVMTTDPVTVAPDTDAGTASTRMRDRGVGRLPVVRDGRLVGLLTRSDLDDALEALRDGGEVGEPSSVARYVAPTR